MEQPLVNGNGIIKEVLVQNPLWKCDPPGITAEGPDFNLEVLRQAETIRDTLERIGAEDPSARAHHFPFLVYPQNVAVLEQKGFTCVWQEPYTLVGWHHRKAGADLPFKVTVL